MFKVLSLFLFINLGCGASKLWEAEKVTIYHDIKGNITPEWIVRSTIDISKLPRNRMLVLNEPDYIRKKLFSNVTKLKEMNSTKMYKLKLIVESSKFKESVILFTFCKLANYFEKFSLPILAIIFGFTGKPVGSALLFSNDTKHYYKYNNTDRNNYKTLLLLKYTIHGPKPIIEEYIDQTLLLIDSNYRKIFSTVYYIESVWPFIMSAIFLALIAAVAILRLLKTCGMVETVEEKNKEILDHSS